MEKAKLCVVCGVCLIRRERASCRQCALERESLRRMFLAVVPRIHLWRPGRDVPSGFRV
jgi:hypothetical protein